MDSYDSILTGMGLHWPELPPPAGLYVPVSRSGSILFIAGQIPREGGKPAYLGKLGRDFEVEQGKLAARACALQILALVRDACGGNLDRVVRCLRLGGFVNCTDSFVDQPQVIDGASELIVAVLGERGRHARAAVGVASLPRGVAVEVEAQFEIAS